MFYVDFEYKISSTAINSLQRKRAHGEKQLSCYAFIWFTKRA